MYGLWRHRIERLTLLTSMVWSNTQTPLHTNDSVVSRGLLDAAQRNKMGNGHETVCIYTIFFSLFYTFENLFNQKYNNTKNTFPSTPTPEHNCLILELY